MNKFIILFFALCLGLLSSCTTNSNGEESSITEESDFTVKSTLTMEDFEKIRINTNRIAHSRVSLNDEDVCKETLKPLIQDGKAIQAQLIKNIDKDSSGQKDKEYISNLNDEELAKLSFMIYHLGLLDGSSTQATAAKTSSVNLNKIKDCLSFALGVTAIKELGLTGCITAATVRQALIAVGKRYLGYVGVVLMVADFYDCFYG